MQVNWVIGNDNPTAWAEFANKMKEGLLHAFDSSIDLRQEEVKRSENQQAMPGWNFCTFFILKVCLLYLKHPSYAHVLTGEFSFFV
jgi:hypothetical protein